MEIPRGNLAQHIKIILFCSDTVYPKKYAQGFCFAVLCCGYTLTDFPISIRLTSLALWQSNDYPSASKAWWIWINTSCEFITNDCITTTKQSTTTPCAYFLGYTVQPHRHFNVPRVKWKISWWRHQMGTLSALRAICAGKSPVTGEFPAQRPVTRVLCFLWSAPE